MNTSENQKPEDTNKKKTHKWRNRLLNLLIILLLLVGLGLVFNEQIKGWIVSYTSSSKKIDKYTVKDLNKNKEAKASFDFDQVKEIDFQSVLNGKMNEKNVKVIGWIAIPSVKINIPIAKGIDNYTLTFAAGTMRSDQVMGQNNYPLASHHMNNSSLLFGPLININMGDKIYLTDKQYVYTYKTDFKETLSPYRVDLIEDVPGKTQVTLVTCDNYGSKRLIVQGSLVKKTEFSKASQKVLKAFDAEKNNR